MTTTFERRQQRRYAHRQRMALLCGYGAPTYTMEHDIFLNVVEEKHEQEIALRLEQKPKGEA